VVLGDDVELVGVRREIVVPVEAERVEQLAAGALDEDEEADVVEDVQRVEVIEIDALDRAERDGREHAGPS